jgi:uncharacterized protein YndB with AHSA1/START domain
MNGDGIPPVRRSVVVGCDQAGAFTMFTGEAGRWWPLAGHSVYDQDSTGLTMDARPGGQIVETGPGGECVVWGTFLRVEPPALLVFSWHPGWGADQATEVEVRFSPDPAGTLVELEHRHGERHPRQGAAREQYGGERGWAIVLGRFAALVDKPDTSVEVG